MDTLTAKIYKSPKTVLTTRDLALLWKETNSNKLKAKAAYYVKQKVLIRLTRGVFAKTPDYEPKELATSLYTPSYISFETVLRESGMVFQHYDTVFAAGPWAKIIKVDKYNFHFRKLKNQVLYNPAGILHKNGFSIACPERAFLDMIYISPTYYFDNLHQLDWDKCRELVPLYANKELVKRLTDYQKKYAQ